MRVEIEITTRRMLENRLGGTRYARFMNELHDTEASKSDPESILTKYFPGWEKEFKMVEKAPDDNYDYCLCLRAKTTYSKKKSTS